MQSPPSKTVEDYLGRMQASLPQQYIQAVGGPLVERSQSIQDSLSAGKILMSPGKTAQLFEGKLYERPLLNRQMNRITEQKKQCEQQLKNLNQQFSRFDQLERQLMHNRLQQKRLTRQLQQHKMKEMTEQARNNIKMWQQQKSELQQKKKEIAERHQQITQQMKKEEELLEIKEQEERKLRKLQQHEQLMKQIEQRRKRRLEIQQKQASKPHELPKYIQMMDKFRSEEEEKRFEIEFLKKKQKSEKSISFAKIKEHERNYMTSIREKKVDVKLAEHASDFTLFKTMEDKKLEKEKQKRRMSYQSKLSQIHVEISDQKQLESEILRDKSRNPMKYIFLGQKGLSDFQIYEEFKQFQIESDQRKLGVEYLNQQKEKHKDILEQERKPRSLEHKTSSHELPLPEKLPPKYINYLPTLSLKKLDQIETVIRNKKDKGTKISMLIERSSELEGEALKKIQNARHNQAKNYNESIKVEDEIDKLYVQSLRTKLACAELAI